MGENERGKIEEAQRLYKKGDFPQALSIIGDLKKDIYADINKCILFDRLGWDEKLALELANIMKNPEINQCDDYRIWDSLAFLNYKIQKFEDAILCMARILETETPLELEIQTFIRKSYCLEAQYKFDEAIEILEKVIKYNVIKYNPSALHPFKSDIFHGLGHFYNERGNLKKTLSDIRIAEQYMKNAADLDPKYYPCLGTIHSENKKYQKALSVFNEALGINEIKNNDHIYNEILFYKADALGWLGEYSEADKLFDKFEEYCEKYGNRDGKAHCLVSKLETTLRGRSIFDITEGELSSWLELLDINKPSLYANKAIHEEWKKLKYLLEGIYKLKCFFQENNDTINISDISRCFNKAVEIMESNVSLLTLTDKPNETKNLKEYNSLKIISEHPSDFEIKLLAKDDVWIVLLFESCPGRYIAWIAERAKEKTIILYFNETVESQIPPEIKTKTFVLNDINEAVSIAYTLSLYDFLRKDLIKPFFLFGMTPTTQAPSFSSQTGWVDELIIGK